MAGFFFLLPVGDLQPIMRDTVTFDIGSADENTISLNALVLDDLLVEGTESITLVGSIISGPPGASFISGQDTVTFNILDNDCKFHPLYRHNFHQGHKALTAPIIVANHTLLEYISCCKAVAKFGKKYIS